MYFRDIESDPKLKQEHDKQQKARASERLKKNTEYKKHK